VQCGQVLFWPSHQFDDGGSSDKLLIVLNDQRDGLHLAAYTTSKFRAGLPDKEGCHTGEGIYFIPKNVWGFSKNTWVQLHRVKEYPVDHLENLYFKKTVRELRCLSAAAVAALANCYQRCPDSSEHHEWLLGKRKQRPDY
jgi:hypothetical protein